MCVCVCVRVMGLDVASLRECDGVRGDVREQQTSELGWAGVPELRESLFLRSRGRIVDIK